MWDVSLNQNSHCLSPYICKWLTLAYFHFPNIFVTLPIITVPPHMVYIIFLPKSKGTGGGNHSATEASLLREGRRCSQAIAIPFHSLFCFMGVKKQGKDKSSINRQKQIKTSPHVPDKYLSICLSIANGSTLEPFGSFYSLKRIH